MSLPAIVCVVVGTSTLQVLVVLLVQLVREVKRMTSSVVRYQREVRPVLESIQRDAQSAQEHSARVQERAEGLRAVPEPGGRRSGPRRPARRQTSGSGIRRALGSPMFNIGPAELIVIL